MRSSRQSNLAKIASVLLLTILLLAQQSVSPLAPVPQQQAMQTHAVPATASSLRFAPNLGQ